MGLDYTTVAGSASLYPGAKQFMSEFTNRFRRPPEPFAAEAYDAALVALKAIESAIRLEGGRRPTREEVSAAIRRLERIHGVADAPG